MRPTLPAMIDITAQSAAMGWVMIVAIETFNRTEGGIGAAIYSYSSTNQKAEVYVYLVIIGLIAVSRRPIFLLAETNFISLHANFGTRLIMEETLLNIENVSKRFFAQ